MYSSLVTSMADADCDLDDVDRLYDDILAGVAGGPSDLDGSGTVDNADIDDWLATAGAENGKVYLAGDANLDGTVGGGDFTTLAAKLWQYGFCQVPTGEMVILTATTEEVSPWAVATLRGWPPTLVTSR